MKTAPAVTSIEALVRVIVVPLAHLRDLLTSIGGVAGWADETVRLLIGFLKTCTALTQACKVGASACRSCQARQTCTG